MATILFDFDSTLVPVESLEEVLRDAVADDGDALRRIDDLTRRGMEGELPFRASLDARLAIAEPTREATLLTGERLADGLTEGAASCIAELRASGHEVRIVSGGLRDVILPSARALGLLDGDVHAVSVRWSDTGDFGGFEDDGFAESKVVGLSRLNPAWPRPVVVVGDGATDHALATSGIADAFVAFTGHVRRGFVDEAGVPSVDSMRDLAGTLDAILPGLSISSDPNA